MTASPRTCADVPPERDREQSPGAGGSDRHVVRSPQQRADRQRPVAGRIVFGDRASARPHRDRQHRNQQAQPVPLSGDAQFGLAERRTAFARRAAIRASGSPIRRSRWTCTTCSRPMAAPTLRPRSCLATRWTCCTRPAGSRARTSATHSRRPIRSASALVPADPQGRKAIDLADQVELVKITPQYLSSDELSRLWTAMQARYRPTMVYQVSTILIQGKRAIRKALPVLARGKDDTGIGSQPNLDPAAPDSSDRDVDPCPARHGRRTARRRGAGRRARTYRACCSVATRSSPSSVIRSSHPHRPV